MVISLKVSTMTHNKSNLLGAKQAVVLTLGVCLRALVPTLTITVFADFRR